MQLSESARGVRWLRNFEAKDQDLAARLLDSLRIASTSTVEQGILKIIGEVASRDELLPAWIIPAQDLNDVVPNWKALSRAPVMFENGLTPQAPINTTPGSEGIVGHVVREALKSLPSDACIKPSAPLEEVRKRRAKSLILVTDFTASGDQLRNYALTFLRNNHIRSWRSGGLLKVVGVSYTTTIAAQKNLIFGKTLDNFAPATISPTAFDLFAEEIDLVKQLCAHYLKGTKRDREFKYLGYRNSAVLQAFHYGVPNNLPPIFTQEFPGWYSLFPKRVFPSDVIDELSKLSSIDLGNAPRSLVWRQRKSVQRLIELLQEIVGGVHGCERLSLELKMSMRDVELDLATLENLGLIDDAGRATAEGRRAIGRRRMRGSSQSARDEPKDPYYPVSLR